MVTDFGTFSWTEFCLYFGACGIIIVYEFILGVVRVQDYFAAYYDRFDSSSNFCDMFLFFQIQKNLRHWFLFLDYTEIQMTKCTKEA